MRCSTILTCLLTLGIFGVSLAAEARSRGRFHVVTPELRSRLKSNTQRSLAAVGQIRLSGSSGTAFVVSPVDATGHAYMMTNRHCVPRRGTGKADVLFHKGSATIKANVVQVVAKSRRLDYALLKVKLPKSLYDIVPIRLSGEPLVPGEKTYSAGYPGLGFKLRSRGILKLVSLPTTRQQDQQLRGFSGRKRVKAQKGLLGAIYGQGRHKRGAPKGYPQTLQTGQAQGKLSGFQRSIVSLFGWGPSQAMHLPSYHGSSGSPIISTTSNEAKALLFAGTVSRKNPDRNSLVKPMALILKDLSRKLSQRSIALDNAPGVTSLLKAAR